MICLYCKMLTLTERYGSENVRIVPDRLGFTIIAPIEPKKRIDYSMVVTRYHPQILLPVPSTLLLSPSLSQRVKVDQHWWYPRQTADLERCTCKELRSGH